MNINYASHDFIQQTPWTKGVFRLRWEHGQEVFSNFKPCPHYYSSPLELRSLIQRQEITPAAWRLLKPPRLLSGVAPALSHAKHSKLSSIVIFPVIIAAVVANSGSSTCFVDVVAVASLLLMLWLILLFIILPVVVILPVASLQSSSLFLFFFLCLFLFS